jgi:CDP-diacylglycerol--serine O-phosphatidyltransferase
VNILSSLNKFIIIAFFLTILNVSCGLIGIIASIYFSSEFFYLPLQLLIFGAIFDFLDGKIAKMSPIESTLGKYSDSIGDTITFAILPGIMVLNAPIIGNDLPNLAPLFGLGVAGFYSLCGWARLVRYTFRPTTIHFEGFPSPAAALFVGSIALLAQFSEMEWLFWSNGLPLTSITVIVGLLMILTIKYPNPKRQMKSDLILIGVAGVVVMIFVLLPQIVTLTGILIIVILYTILGPLYLIQTEKMRI